MKKSKHNFAGILIYLISVFYFLIFQDIILKGETGKK